MRARLVTRSSQHDFRSVDLFDTVAPRLSGYMADFYGAYLDERMVTALRSAGN